MPTVSYIWEGAWDRYFESLPALEYPLASPARFLCPFCSDALASYEILLEHLAQRHRGERPVLLLNGQEPGGDHRITALVHSGSAIIENCTSCTASIDGAIAVSFDVREVPDMLSRQRDSLVDLELINAFDRLAQPIRQRYRLTFRVATRAELNAVDHAFRRHLAVEALTLTGIDAFLSEACCRGVARDYANALAAYVRGILLKDRPVHVAVTLPYSNYRELYGQALEILQMHRRPLADLVCAMIRFGRNDFRFAKLAVGSPLLDYANSTLGRTVADNNHAPVADATTAPSGILVPACPVDDGVSRVLVLAGRLGEARHWSATLEEECRQTTNAITLDAPDREKALALWATAALRLNAQAAAQEPLALLSATYPFGLWASRERERNAE